MNYFEQENITLFANVFDTKWSFNISMIPFCHTSFNTNLLEPFLQTWINLNPSMDK